MPDEKRNPDVAAPAFSPSDAGGVVALDLGDEISSAPVPV